MPVSIPRTSKINAAKKLRKIYDKIRQKKAKKLAQIEAKGIVEKPKVYTKSEG